MKFKRKATKAEIEKYPGWIQSLYVETDEDGVYEVDDDFEGFDEDGGGEPSRGHSGNRGESERVREFRDRNIELQRKLEAIEGKYKGLDPGKLQAAMAAFERMEGDKDLELLKAGRHDEWLAKKTEQLRAQYEQKVQALMEGKSEAEKRADARRGMLREVLIAKHLDDAAAAAKISVSPTARADFHRRGFEAFDLDDEDRVVAKQINGETRYNEQNKRYGPVDFVKELATIAPHLLVSGSGSKSSPGSPPRGSNGKPILEMSASDPHAFGRNLDAIAKGEVDVKVTN